MVRPAKQTEALAFSGIHVVSPRIFSLMDKALRTRPESSGGDICGEHAFPIIPMYLRLAGDGEKIVAFQTDGDYWRDLGTVASLQQAAADIEQKVLEI